jgi:hypothetical protein
MVMDRSYNITGSFSPATECYGISATVYPGNGGWVTSSPGNCSGGYTPGTVAEYTAHPRYGYAFDTWTDYYTGAYVSSDNPLSLVMTADRDLLATFVPILPCYVLTTTVAPPGAGFIHVYPYNNCINAFLAGTQVRLTARETTANDFAGWSGDASGSAMSIVITMDADRTVTGGLALPPTLGTRTPARAVPGGPGFTLSVAGGGFAPTSIVRWNGADLPTTYVSGLLLTAGVDAARIAAPGVAHITVFNPALPSPVGFETGVMTLDIRPLSHIYLPLILRRP